jgi:hypothetical protein
MNALQDEVRHHLKRERELHAYALRLAAKLEAHPHLGQWMIALARLGRHRCTGWRPPPPGIRARSRDVFKKMGPGVPSPR